MPKPLPISRDPKAKLERILRISARCFAEKGFEATSIRDISRATCSSLSGLYYYFKSKQYLLYLIQNSSFITILEQLQVRLQATEDPSERLYLLVQNHVEYFLSHPNEMKVLSHEEDALEGPLREQVGSIKRRYFALARQIFDDVVADDLAPGLNSRVAVLSLFGMMNWVYKWHKPQLDPGAQELTAAIVGIFLHGVIPGSARTRELFVVGGSRRDSRVAVESGD
jgi:TetR/AcrR family transcriptional regulator, cholesterol catabolism regulator